MLVQQLYWLLKELGFGFKVLKDPRRWSGLGGLRTTKKKDIKHFLEIGGSLTHIRIRKSKKAGIYSNNNFFKQTLLKAIYELLQKYEISKHFPTLEDAKKYAKHLIDEFLILRNKFQKLEEDSLKNQI
ncbi:MAG: hypothetical protein ACP5O8_00845 [Candidatus Aenigmatarchaeota archaeon]